MWSPPHADARDPRTHRWVQDMGLLKRREVEYEVGKRNWWRIPPMMEAAPTSSTMLETAEPGCRRAAATANLVLLRRLLR